MHWFVTFLDLIWRRRFTVSIVVGAMAGLALFATAEPPADSGVGAFMRMIPLGVESRGAVIPSFDASGRRTSLITADVVRRIDDGRLYAEQLVLQMFDEDPAADVRIDLRTAFYHMEDGVLRSTERSRVTRADFEIEGDSLIFDTVKNQGRMTGNIRMVIFDSGALSGERPSPSPTQPAK
jgi:hypothetical protein